MYIEDVNIIKRVTRYIIIRPCVSCTNRNHVITKIRGILHNNHFSIKMNFGTTLRKYFRQKYTAFRMKYFSGDLFSGFHLNKYFIFIFRIFRIKYLSNQTIFGRNTIRECFHPKYLRILHSPSVVTDNIRFSLVRY